MFIHMVVLLLTTGFRHFVFVTQITTNFYKAQLVENIQSEEMFKCSKMILYFTVLVIVTPTSPIDYKLQDLMFCI